MKLFDAHGHLHDAVFRPNLENILERAAAAGVVGMAVCGTSLRDWDDVFAAEKENPTQLVPMIGIHPWFVDCHWKENFQTLEKRLREHPDAGIGETGLDFQKQFRQRTEQEESFAAHLDLARAQDRPIAVHCVNAWGRLMELLREHPAPRVLLHAFSGAVELIPELIELNGWFSFCGSVTHPNAKRARAAAVAVPSDRLLIETDAPDFPPAGCSAPNEPAHLIQVARAVAGLRGTSVEEVVFQTHQNARSLFYRSVF